MKECVCDFSLIILVYIFLAFPQIAEPFAHSILGRILAVLLIALYALYDILYGLLFCILVIVYYYTTEPKHRLNYHEGFSSYEYQRESGKTDDFYKMPTGATPYQSFEGEPTNQRGDSERKFVEKNCPRGALTQTDSRGDFPVRGEDRMVDGRMRNALEVRDASMAGHIYPELAYPGPPCNPCSADCAFRVVDKRLRAEEELVHPKSANEWFDTILERLTNAK